MAEVKIVNWQQENDNGNFSGIAIGYGISVNFVAKHDGACVQEIVLTTKSVKGAIRRRVLKHFERAISEFVTNMLDSLYEMLEEEQREWLKTIDPYIPRDEMMTSRHVSE